IPGFTVVITGIQEFGEFGMLRIKIILVTYLNIATKLIINKEVRLSQNSVINILPNLILIIHPSELSYVRIADSPILDLKFNNTAFISDLFDVCNDVMVLAFANIGLISNVSLNVVKLDAPSINRVTNSITQNDLSNDDSSGDEDVDKSTDQLLPNQRPSPNIPQQLSPLIPAQPGKPANIVPPIPVQPGILS
ncbi:29043_t:CDS:2, partial [Gigaspora margarita]